VTATVPAVPPAGPELRSAAPFDRTTRLAALPGILSQRIMVLDGAMGTMLQAHRFGEADFRGERFRDHPRDLRGNSDVLCLTQPAAVAAIHAGYLAAGAEILTTNSFTATRIAQADYGFDPATVHDLNVAAARLARDAADAAELADPERPRFVAGSLGPTNRTASMSAEVGDPAARSVTWDELSVAYRESAAGLIEGGADLLLIETIFDTLNAKAATFAVQSLFDELGFSVPLIISGTIVDASGRTLSGQTVEAFWLSIRTRAYRTSSVATTRRPRRWQRRSGSGPGTASSMLPGAAAARRRSTWPRSPRRSLVCRHARSRSRPARPASPDWRRS